MKNELHVVVEGPLSRCSTVFYWGESPKRVSGRKNLHLATLQLLFYSFFVGFSTSGVAEETDCCL